MSFFFTNPRKSRSIPYECRISSIVSEFCRKWNPIDVNINYSRYVRNR